jgi:hypothetical protein
MKHTLRLFPVLALILIGCGCRALPPQSAAPAAGAVNSTSTTGSQRTAPGATYTIPDSLVSLNKLFLDGYRERQTAVKTNTSPLIVADFASLTLYWNGAAETNRSVPDIYHALKTVAHVPLGIYLRVDPCANNAEASIPDAVLQGLKEYQDQIDLAETSLSQAGFSQSQLVRQERILSACKAYLTKVIRTTRSPRKELISFTQTLGPLMLENANEAAAAQLDMTHAVVMRWKKKIPPHKWKRLVVVVPGLQMPRRMNIMTQYFAKVLGEPSHNLGYPLESRRLIYAEFILKGRDPLDLMATTFIDGDASEAFFGNRWRMSRDVLADGAEEYLKRLSFDRLPSR